VADYALEKPDLEASVGDLEFRLEDPVAMLSVDELFSDGKLMPLLLSSVKPSPNELFVFFVGDQKKKKKEKKSVLDFVGIRPGFARITVDGIRNNFCYKNALTSPSYTLVKYEHI
jgi:hypothetical protein